MKYVKYILVLPFFYLLLFQSCANTSMPPTGGPKDSIPPVIVSVEPDSNAVNFPLKDGKISIKFNEYVNLVDASKNIFLSPPLTKKPESKIRGKGINISFPLQLDSGITYTLEFGNSITDNNEGNIFPSYSYPFSTGKTIDSMVVSGRVYDYKSLLPIDNIIVAFYENLADSAVYKTLPSKIAKSDKWGYFSVKNLKKTKYNVFAYGDINDNFKFDPENEKIAFIDSVVIPSVVMKKGIPELKYVNEKDTSASLAKPASINLYLFKEPTVKQYIKNSGRKEFKKFYLTFASPNVKIDSLAIEGITSKLHFIKQFNATNDSLVLWIKDTSLVLKDTVNMIVKYQKSDSLDKLFSGYDTLQMIAPKQPKLDPKLAKRANFGQQGEQIRKDLLDLKIEVYPDLVEQYGYSLIFPAPVIMSNHAKIQYQFVTPKGQTGKEDFTITRDEIDSCIYHIKNILPMKLGYEYKLTIHKGAFKDIYKNTNDSTMKSVILPNDEKLSKINLELKGAESSYIIDLTNNTRDKVYRSLKANKDGIIVFPYVAPGVYSIRITKDSNNNGLIDSGSLATKSQPEKVRLYKLPDGNSVIKILESTELTQTIDLKSIFK